jgi:hypothetical protein
VSNGAAVVPVAVVSVPEREMSHSEIEESLW